MLIGQSFLQVYNTSRQFKREEETKFSVFLAYLLKHH
jgi:hypothetical protein